jgi:hypothetical protein
MRRPWPTKEGRGAPVAPKKLISNPNNLFETTKMVDLKYALLLSDFNKT